jgi:hypothetical protein
MWYENPVVEIILGLLSMVVIFATFYFAFNILVRFFKGFYFVIRVLLSPLLCGLFKKHDHRETYRKENSDHYHVESKCRYCGNEIVDQKN